MAGISQIEINGTVFDICDATARDSLSQDYLPLTAGFNKPLINSLYKRDTEIDSTDANNGIGAISDTKKDNVYAFIDKNGSTISRFLSRTSKAGNQQAAVEASNWIESTNTRNWGKVGITLKKDGTSSNELTGEDTYFGNSSSDYAHFWAKTSIGTLRFLRIGGGRKALGDFNGTVARFGAGGLTLIGGGEYAENRYNLGDLSDLTESLYLGADVDVYIEANANTIADRKTWLFKSDGTFRSEATVYLDSSNINRDRTNPSSDTLGATRLIFRDADKERVGEVRVSSLAAGAMQTGLIAISEKSDGTEVINGIYVKAAKDGTTSYSISNATAFREAINAVSCTNQTTMQAYIGSSGASTGCFHVTATVQNSSNTARNNHKIGLITYNDHISLYDNTSSATLWSFTTQNTVETTVSNVITTAANHTITGVTYTARNGVVQLRITFKTSSTATGSHTIGTVVTGKRPVGQVYGSTQASSLNGCTVVPAGTVSVSFAVAPSTSSEYGISFMYLLPNGDMS